jgi:RimJ/RimL family protein N-acetyltransferase
MIEIGPRLIAAGWGRDYAREVARTSLDRAWRHPDADAVLAITARVNSWSWGLMERLGMRRVAGAEFDRPLVTEGSAPRPHIACRADRPA